MRVPQRAHVGRFGASLVETLTVAWVAACVASSVAMDTMSSRSVREPAAPTQARARLVVSCCP